MSTPALRQRRDALAAKLDGMAKPPAEIEQAATTVNAALAAWRNEAATLRAQMETLDAQLGVSEPVDPAIGAKARAQRVAAAHERQRQWGENWKAIFSLEETRLKAIDDAQAATEALRDAVTRALTANERISKLYRALAPGLDVPMPLSPYELARRLGGRIASIMRTIPGQRSRLGGLAWAGGDLYAHPAWAGDEERRMCRTLLDLQKLQPKGA